MLAGFLSVLLSCVCVSIAGLIAVLILMILLSGRIVKPVLVSYEKQKQFITDAGHEIKTPITIIDADAELLEMEFGQNFVGYSDADGSTQSASAGGEAADDAAESVPAGDYYTKSDYAAEKRAEAERVSE